MAIVAVGGTAAAPTSQTFQDVVAVAVRPFGTSTAAVNFCAKSTEFKFGDTGADFETEPTLAGGLLRKYKSRETAEHTVKLYTIDPADSDALINMGTVAAQESGANATGKVAYPTLERKQYRLCVTYTEESIVDAEGVIGIGKKALRHLYRFVEITKCTKLNDDKSLYGVELTFKTQPFNMSKPATDKTYLTYFKDLFEYSEYFDGTATKVTAALGDFDGTNG